MLTEHEVARSWRTLFHGRAGAIGEEVFEKAETLLEALRAESPLRHRLGAELEELRKRATAKKKPAAAKR